MNTIDPADEAQLFATIDRWIEREVGPRVKEFDHADKWPAEIVEQMKEFGLFGATDQPEYGGLGLPATTYCPDRDEAFRPVWMAITGIFNFPPDAGAGGREVRHRAAEAPLAAQVRLGRDQGRPGADRAKRRHRPPVDPHGVSAPQRGGYVINGTKTWISNGIEGSCFALLVKTNPEASIRVTPA